MSSTTYEKMDEGKESSLEETKLSIDVPSLVTLRQSSTGWGVVTTATSFFPESMPMPQRTPSPRPRRYSSSDIILPSIMSPREAAMSPAPRLILVNRTSDFSRTVYEIEDHNIRPIQSSVKKSIAREAAAAATRRVSKIDLPPVLNSEEPQREQSNEKEKLRLSTQITEKGAVATPANASIPPSAVVAPGAAAIPGETKTKELSSGQQPSSEKKKKEKSSSHLMIKLGILLSRSSGRDKFCALLQYGAMFWGNQKVFTVSNAKNATWRNLEDSMSAGRKTLRLFKWIKEYERMQRAWAYPDAGPHATELRIKVASVLGFWMHFFSFAYYFTDNVLYSSQIGLINRPNVMGISELRKMLKSGLSHEEYQKLQMKFRSDEVLRGEQQKFENRLKDWKNYASLWRLLTAIVYCSIQINSAGKAERAVKSDTVVAEKERKKQLWELAELKDENIKEIIASVCNLTILLNRLQMGPFKRVPLWGVGVLGMISAVFGLDKNWPRERPNF